MFSSLQLMYLKQLAKKYAPILVAVFLGVVIVSNYLFYGAKGVILVAGMFAVAIAVMYHWWREEEALKIRLQSDYHYERTRCYDLEQRLGEAQAELEKERTSHEVSKTWHRSSLDRIGALLSRMIDLRRQRLLLMTLLVRAFPSGIRAETYSQEWEADRSLGINDTQAVKVDLTNYSFTKEEPALVNYLYITLPTQEQMRIPLTEEEVRQLRQLPDPVGDYTGTRDVLLETVSFDNFAKLIETHPEVQLALEIKVYERENAANG